MLLGLSFGIHILAANETLEAPMCKAPGTEEHLGNNGLLPDSSTK